MMAEDQVEALLQPLEREEDELELQEKQLKGGRKTVGFEEYYHTSTTTKGSI